MVDEMHCSICGRQLNVPKGDVISRDCGGDCLMCMAEAGDPDCIRAVAQIMVGLLRPSNDAQRLMALSKPYDGGSDNHGS